MVKKKKNQNKKKEETKKVKLETPQTSQESSEKEIFEVEKDGKTEVIEKDTNLKEIEEKEGQVKKEKNSLKNILVVLGLMLFFVAILGGYFLFKDSSTKFSYKGIDFQMVKEGSLLLYNTKVPLYSGEKHTADYNFYLRKDPRYLVKNIDFFGEMKLYKNSYINLTNEFNCGGYGILALANLFTQYQLFGMNLSRNENVSCNPSGNYSQIQVVRGNETYIKQDIKNCYTIYIKECEVLDALERWMVEVFVKFENLSARVNVQPTFIGNN